MEMVEAPERGAFEEIARRYTPRIRLFFALRSRDASQADDLTQETLLAAYRKRDSYDPSRPFYPWLRGIARHVLQNERRRGSWSPLDEALHALAVEEADRLEAAERGDALAACLETLAPAARRLLDGRYREGMSIQALAAREKRGLKAVSVALVRIRVALRDCVAERLPEEPA
jgi:RNA polymerase sigma-70 factor (ECF subfamily)